jgi:hypothetical protein
MGGDRETFVDAKRTGKEAEQIGSIRVHEAAGQVHFHDDQNNLKVAVPSHEFWSAWAALVAGGSKTFIDADQKTILKVSNTLQDLGTPQQLSTRLEIQPIELDDTFQKLHQFVTAR